MELLHEPGVYAGAATEVFHTGITSQESHYPPQTQVVRFERIGVLIFPSGVFPEKRLATYLQRPHRLLQRCLEAAVYGHSLAGGLHLSADNTVARVEFIEGPARYFDHAVVYSRLEGGSSLTRNFICYLIQSFAHSYLCRYTRYGVPCCLARQSRAAADTRVNFNYMIRVLFAFSGLD